MLSGMVAPQRRSEAPLCSAVLGFVLRCEGVVTHIFAWRYKKKKTP